MKIDQNKKPINPDFLFQGLDEIIKKRSGGAVNFKGIHYQVLYSCYIVLEKLGSDSTCNTIRLEGIEDVDINMPNLVLGQNEYIQMKSSINKMDAATFWNLGVLQNFLEVYQADMGSTFRLVYNMKISDGNLSNLINYKNKPNTISYWTNKLNTLNPNVNAGDFIRQISFEYKSFDDLYAKILTLLFDKWNINKGAEYQFLKSLFYNIFVWSVKRTTIDYTHVNKLFQEVRDSYSKVPTNLAFQNSWIVKTSYQITDVSSEDYYDGRAARPSHIGLGLPARRKVWEKTIEDNISESDITLIKASSGQGKSTLAWQVSFNLKDSYDIYQLHICRDVNEANSVIEFLESRISIGEKPLVIIDGLNSLVSAWTSIVEKTQDYSIKFLITTREEDWYRFGADISRIHLNTVEISISMKEAKDIFEQFKRRGKIHTNIKEWQPVWEQVHESGLLIEYTFLLTKGQMITERLSAQLKYLSNSQSSASKMEILRLISLADCLNIKIKTESLIYYIKSEIGFDQDRGEILNELEKEYFLSFDGFYVGGLHPVRSRHLMELLHKNLPLDRSLINLYKILDVNYKYEFFINIPTVIISKNKSSFYKILAKELANQSFSDMVLALDGIMHSEPQHYWNENKSIFDEAFDTGGIDIFCMSTVPFSKLNSLEEFSKIMGDKGAVFKYLSDLKNKLPVYTFKNTDLFSFAKELNNELKLRSAPIVSFNGLEFLVKWFRLLNFEFYFPAIKMEIEIKDLIKTEIQEAKEILLYFQITNPALYKSFIDLNKNIIISYLKVKTNSQTIEEANNNIQIKYLLCDDEIGKANEISLSKLDVIQALLPFYNEYFIEGILLPFPSEKIVSVSRINSTKKRKKENAYDKFDVHLNQIWLATILKNYQETSAYGWQNNILNIRKVALDWCKNSIRILDALLEGNDIKKNSAVELAIGSGTLLSEMLAKKKTYPKYEKQYLDKSVFRKEENDINSWFTSLSNLKNQFLNIFVPKGENDRNVALINLKYVHLNLRKMQYSYKVIENKTIAYFETKNVCDEELEYFERLYKTVLYYLSQIPLEDKKAISVTKKVVKEWWETKQSETVNELQSILTVVEETSDYKFILPSRLIEEGSLTYATFGVLNFDSRSEDVYVDFSMRLIDLANLPIDFYTVINIENNIAIGAIRFRKDYFVEFAKLFNGEEVDIEDYLPMPIILTEEILSQFNGIRMPENSVLEDNALILLDLWKLSEYRKRLNLNSEIEKEWLEITESKFQSNIKHRLIHLTKSSQEFRDFVDNGLNKSTVYTDKEIVNQLHQLVLS